MPSMNQAEIRIWRLSAAGWVPLVGAFMLASVFSFDALNYMVQVYSSQEEYSYAYVIPAISLFLVWQKKNKLERIAFRGSWAGVFVVALGYGLFLLGELSTLYVVVQYALLTVLIGLTLSFTGWHGIRPILVPLLFLAFMIPLPAFLYNNLSAELQLISSQLGVALIRLFGISVFLEGNVIDLGALKLQVAEACNGLRYLFPLSVIAFIAAYFFKGALWKRAAIGLSAIPIAIAMNGFRIGVIGMMVEYGGLSMAEGFLHDFEGWAVFMACTGVLVLEMWALARIGKESRPLSEVFGLAFPAPRRNAEIQYRPIPKPLWGAVAVSVLMTTLSLTLPQRNEIPPPRKEFSHFPLNLDQWRGKGDRIEQIYIDTLKFDDYILADFLDAGQRRVNLYVAYYASQRKGESAHSPRSCIPGAGWEIASLTQRTVFGAAVAGQPLKVNRAVIHKGESKQLVYYWFLQRGRVITNEYLVKWYLFWDALTRNRTDGALIRLMTAIEPAEAIEQADRKLSAFARIINPQLEKYVPD